MKNIDLIVFDLDGTIADTAPEIQACLNAALTQWKLSSYSVHEVKGFVGNGAKVLAERALRGRVLELRKTRKIDESNFSDMWLEMLDSFFSDFMAVYRQSDNRHTVLYDGVTAFLDNPPVPLGLLTNKPTVPTQLFLQHFKLTGAFGVVVTGESAPKPKPHPAGLQQIIKEMNTIPERTLMVGDGKPDVEVAKAVGAKSCAVLQGFATEPELRSLEPDWIVPTFSDFVAQCTRIL